MKTKLHLGVLVVLMAFLATFFESTTLPNQQIVIQFLDKDIARNSSESAIESVKQQLRSIGAALIKIDKNEAGQLVITYYSETDIEQIQNLLNNANDFELANESEDNGATSLPDGKAIKDYKLDISEIHNNNPIHWNFEITEILDINQKHSSSLSFQINSAGQTFNEHCIISKLQVALQHRTTVSFTFDAQFYKIPEVRAGPYIIGLS